jgi:hypothetical protein
MGAAQGNSKKRTMEGALTLKTSLLKANPEPGPQPAIRILAVNVRSGLGAEVER